MQTLMRSNLSSVPRSYRESELDSYDCHEEFSLYHWIHVYRLVKEADIFEIDEEFASSLEAEPERKKPISEVEPSTTYQHLAGNVI